MTTPLMPADHLRVVRNTWVRLQGTYKVEELGAMTLTHFFRQHPHAVAFFPQLRGVDLEHSAELQQLANALMQALNPVLTEDHKLDALANAAHACGCALAHIGLHTDQLEEIMACLHDVMEEVLDKRWSPEIEEAWQSVSMGLLYVLEPAIALSSIEFPTTDPQYIALTLPDRAVREALEASWHHVKDKTQTVGIQMFNKMFKMAPTTRELCEALLVTPEGYDTPLLAQHGENFMNQLGFCTTRLMWRETAVPYLVYVAEVQTNTFELEIEHMVFFGKALLFALKEGMGDAWTSDFENAWREFWGLIHEVMKIVIARKRESASRKKMRELGSIYSPQRTGEAAVVRSVGFVSNNDELRALQKSVDDQQTLQQRTRSPRQGQRLFVPPTSSSNFDRSDRQQIPRPAATPSKPSPAIGSPVTAGLIAARVTSEPLPVTQPSPAPVSVSEVSSAGPSSTASSGAASSAPKPATFHFAGTCMLYKLQDDGRLSQINPPDAYTPEGLLGVVLLSHSDAPSSILVYNKKKQQSFSAEVTADSFELQEDKPFAYRIRSDPTDCHVIAFRSVAEQVKFGVQLSLAKSMLWQGVEGPMVLQDVVAGKGRKVRKGDTVGVRFTAYTETERGTIGAMFDGNVAEGTQALSFKVGAEQVLAGLEAGAVGMSPGGIRRLVVPPSKGYGAEGVAGIVPPNSVIHIELTIESVGENGTSPPAGKVEEEGSKDDNTNGSSTLSAEATVTPVFHYARVCSLYEQAADRTWEMVVAPDAYNEQGQLGLVMVTSGTAERKVVVYDKNKQAVVQTTIDASEANCKMGESENAFVLNVDGKPYQIVLKNEAEQSKFAVQLALARSAAAGMAPGAKDVEPDLIVQDMIVGSGVPAVAGEVVKVRYQGWLEGEGGRGTIGAVFDGNMSSEADMLEFTIGQGQVVQGLDDGVVGMRTGGKRHLIVPPRMGYGAAGVAGHVPRNSIIHLELELHEKMEHAPSDGVHGRSEGGSIRSSNHITNEDASDSDRASSKLRIPLLSSALSNQAIVNSPAGTPGMIGSPVLKGRAGWSTTGANEETFTSLPFTKIGGSFGGTFQTNRYEVGDRGSEAGGTGPVFHHMSTCHTLKYVEGGFAPLQMPGYGADKSLGYVVMTPGQGESRKLIVYAPVFQADLTEPGSVQHADPSVGLENCYKVSDEGGQKWLVVLKGQDQSTRFEKQVDLGGEKVQLDSVEPVPEAAPVSPGGEAE